MSGTTAAVAAPSLWSEEPSSRPGRRRMRARIGGLHCSLCTGTIEKALGREPGVEKVAVSLTHEQALIEYDPSVARAETLLQTLKDIGYTISDPRKLRPFDEDEALLAREGRRFVAAVGASLAAIALVANPAGFWTALLAGVAFGSLAAFLFVVLVLGFMWPGWLRLRLPWFPARAEPVGGAWGAFALGIPFSVAICPFCTPALLVMLTAAAGIGSVPFGFALLLAFALGRSVPIVVGAVSIAWLESLKGLARWQRLFEVIGALALIGSGAYLINEYFFLM